MEGPLRDVEERFGIAIADSALMRLMHEAMDRAHERVKSRHGLIAQLNEISRFYELAVMQLEGCLKYVEAESGGFNLESSDEEMLRDLRKIRDRLKHRLAETEIAISKQDRELEERLENEQRLACTLELKEKELVSMRANLELERTKGGEEVDRDMTELRHSLQNQMTNIKQWLEPQNKHARRERNSSFDSTEIGTMGEDIDMLKGTLDLAFNKIHGALFLSGICPTEQKWSSDVEKDILAILIRGFVEDFTANLEARTLKNQERRDLCLRDKSWKHLSREIRGVRSQLESVNGFDEVQLSSPENCTSGFNREMWEGWQERIEYEKIKAWVIQDEFCSAKEYAQKTVSIDTDQDRATRLVRETNKDGDKGEESNTEKRLLAEEGKKLDIEIAPKGVLDVANPNLVGFPNADNWKDVLSMETALEEEVLAVFVRERMRDWEKMIDAVQGQSFHNRMARLMDTISALLVDQEENGSIVQAKLEETATRLKTLERRVQEAVELAARLGREGSIYRNAFIRRCENLLKAEIEVDLLGDQVDALHQLLVNINSILLQNWAVLQAYPEIMQVSKLIENELRTVLPTDHHNATRTRYLPLNFS